MSRVPFALQSVPFGNIDEIERVLDRVVKGADGYPPYNIERCDRANGQPDRLANHAGGGGDLPATNRCIHGGNQLVIRVASRRKRPGNISIAHRRAPLPRTFVLRRDVRVLGRGSEARLLSIDLARPEPEKIVKTTC